MSVVLVVDDETSIRELLYDTLTLRGHQVTTVGSGEQALDMLKTQRPQLILVDASMPGLSGLETVKRIRVFVDEAPIVLLTAPGDPPVAPEDLRRAGIGETVRKEPDRELFFNMLDGALKRLERRTEVKPEAPGVRVPGTLLIVDDDAQLLRLLLSFFSPRGIRVLLANSGEEALKALAQKPTVVLLDLNMPGMDGLMTLRKIKAADPDLPVLMVSGVGEESTMREALDAGAYDYLTKPFSLEYLETVVLTKILLGLDE